MIAAPLLKAYGVISPWNRIYLGFETAVTQEFDHSAGRLARWFGEALRLTARLELSMHR